MQRNLWDAFKFIGEGGGASAAPAAAPPAAAPAAAPPAAAPPSTPSATPPAAAPVTPPTSTGGAPPPSSTPSAPAAAPSWLESFRSAGLPVGKDENETLETLKRIYQERQHLEAIRPLVPHLTAYQRDAQKFQAWQAEQQRAAAPPQQGEKPWWSDMWAPPEFNQNWLTQVRRDENGNLVALPGAAPDTALKVQQYQAWRAEQAEKFMSNPWEFMQGGIDKRATMIAEKIIGDRLTQFQNQQAAQQFVGANMSWLYELDANQQPKMQMGYDQLGQPVQTRVLSPWGQRYTQHLKDAMEMGINDQPRMQAYAQRMTQADYALAQQQPAPAPAAPAPPPQTPQQQANARFIRQNNPPAAPTPTGGNTNPAPIPITRKNLELRMREKFAAAGLTDQTLNN